MVGVCSSNMASESINASSSIIIGVYRKPTVCVMYLYICMCVCVYIYIYVYVCIYVYIYIYIYVCVYVCSCSIRSYKCTCDTYMHTFLSVYP